MVPAIAHKGVYRYKCCVRGKEAHSSLTPKSVNAIEMAARVIGKVRDMVCTAAAPVDALAIGGSSMGLTVFGTAGAVLIFIYWVITGTSLDAPAAPQRARTS